MKRICRLMMSTENPGWQVLLGASCVLSGFLGCGPGSSTITTPTPEAADTRVAALDVTCEVAEVPDHYQWYFNVSVEDDQGWVDVQVVQIAIPDANSELLYDVQMDGNGNDGNLTSYWANESLFAFDDVIDCTLCPSQTFRIRAQDEEDVRLGEYTERVYRGEDVCSKYAQ